MYSTNIVDVYLRATESDIEQGIAWYPRARELANQWANGDIWKGAGVIAAYSPATNWKRNLELAKDSLLTGLARTDSLGMNVSKAQAILDGAPVLATLNGPKTTAFASAIADPNTSMVTVDSHMLGAAMGYWIPTSKAKLGIRTYRAISLDLLDTAYLAGYHISEWQAIIWTAWRNRHYNPIARKGEDG